MLESEIIIVGQFKSCICPQCDSTIRLWESDHNGSIIECPNCDAVIKLKDEKQ